MVNYEIHVWVIHLLQRGLHCLYSPFHFAICLGVSVTSHNMRTVNPYSSANFANVLAEICRPLSDSSWYGMPCLTNMDFRWTATFGEGAAWNSHHVHPAKTLSSGWKLLQVLRAQRRYQGFVVRVNMVLEPGEVVCDAFACPLMPRASLFYLSVTRGAWLLKRMQQGAISHHPVSA